FSGGGFDEVCSGHHGDQTRLCDIAQSKQVAGAENHFQVRRATSVFEGDDFVIKFLPLCAERMRASDNHVNFLRAGGNGAANFGNPIFKGRKSSRKSGRNSGDIDFRAFECAARCFHKKVINTDCTNLNVQVSDSKFLDKLVLERLASFGAETANALVGVMDRKCREVHAGDGAEEPGNLPLFLDGAASDERGCATLDCAGVYANAFNPIEIERSAAVRLKRTAGECSDCARCTGDGMAVTVDNVETRGIFRIHGKAPRTKLTPVKPNRRKE